MSECNRLRTYINIYNYQSVFMKGHRTKTGEENQNSQENSSRNNVNCDPDQPQLSSASSTQPSASSEQTNSPLSDDTVEKAIQQRSYRLEELLESEKVYVKDLEQCVEYIKYMRETKDTDDPNEIAMPEDLRDGKDRMIFGNIEAIFEWHRE